jgi:regulator of protease activity HflC (stomatin/prohibitin superfamily)
MRPPPTDLASPYHEPYRAVLAALGREEMGDLPGLLRAFELTPHELAVLRALEWLLAGDEQLRPRRLAVAPGSRLTLPTLDTLAAYHRRTIGSENVLRWALLVHDVAKQRGLSGPHPEHCARVAQRILAHVATLSEAERSLVVWLVRYHDVLGNIYCGERAPGFLLEMSRGLEASELVHRLTLLQVVMLCDLRGTWDGTLLTEEKARFWLDLSSPERILRRQADLFAWRVERWTGSVAGDSDASAERALRDALFLDDETERRNLERAFGSRISYIVYGFYLFTALGPARLATLMKRVAQAAEALPAEHLTLAFDTVYRPVEFQSTDDERQAARRALEHYAEQLDTNRLGLRVAGAADGSAPMTIHVE